MHHATQTFWRKPLLSVTGALGLLLAVPAARAATYTAAASGNFTSAATWSGGVAPSTTLTGDVIVIPNNITVTLNQSAVFSGALAGLTVNGSLVSSNNSSLTLNSTPLTGSGSINVDSLALNMATSLAYTGSITAQRMSTTGLTLATAASVTVVQQLRLVGGILAVNAGSLNLSSGATFVVSGGVVTNSGSGLLGLTNGYNLRYEGSAGMTTGLEAGGSGLRKLEIATAATTGVSLSSDLNVRDTMTLTSGYLRLSGRSLTFSGGGNFAASGSGTLVANGAGSSINLTSNTSFAGGLRFRSDSNTVNSITVNSSSAGSTMFRLGSTVMVSGSLNLQNGRLAIDSNRLLVNGGATGGSSSSYVVTGRNGRLGLMVSGSSMVMYPIGTMLYFAPAALSANSGNASGMLSIGVEDSVRAAGTSGTAFSATRKVVNATWHVTSAMATGININLTTMWNSAMEVNGFNRNQAYISHYTNGSWDVAASSSAVSTSAGLYSLTRSNITSLSPFAVVDRDYALAVPAAMAAASLRAFPNPATQVLQISGPLTGSVQAAVYNEAGMLVKSVPVTNNAVPVSDLASGLYQVRLTSAEGTSVLRFVKQ